jgi:hypothetical protein
MPAYANLVTFMNFVTQANPNFEKSGLVKSSLRPLINVLQNATGTATQVCQALRGIPVAKANRYIDALYYLLATYPGLPANAYMHLNLGALHQSNAAMYTRAVMPGDFNPVGAQNQRVFVTPNSASLNMPLEKFILSNSPAMTGIMLIHLSDFEPGMQMIFAGRSTIQHINSVLRVGRLRGCALCVLTMKANADVCADLLTEFNQFANVTRVYEPVHHMGSHDASFRNFAANHPNLIVMGFDACVCVFANVFGANEHMPNNGGFRPPLATLTNVIMSRAALVTLGTITVQTPSMGASEYGPLFNT